MAMKFQKDDLATLAYWLGVTFLLAGGGWYILHREFDAVIRVALVLTVLVVASAIILDPERVRKALTGRQARYGSNAFLYSLAFFGILAVLNFLIFTNPVKWDLTEDNIYSLSPETMQLLEALPGEVRFLGFYTVNLGSSRESVRPLLDQYKLSSNGMLDYEFIDPDENPFVAQQYNVIRDGSLVVVKGETSEVVETVSEEKITQALIKVLYPQDKKAYFLVGHGERDIEGTDEFGYSQTKKSLESNNYQVENLNLISAAIVPEDASTLIICSPLAQFLPEEIDSIDAYMQAGGSLIVLLEPTAVPLEEGEMVLLEDYLISTWGIEVSNNLVVDMSSELPFYAISSYYGQHPITEELGNLFTYFPTARSLSVMALEDPSIDWVELVQTGENSWGEEDFTAIENQEIVEFNEGSEKSGPLPIVISAENSNQGSRLVVFGDADFASNVFFFELGNGDLFLNSVGWVIGEDELISITPKDRTSRFVVPPSNQVVGTIFLITLILIPGMVIVLGVVTWWQRRKQA
jgi:ABC-type uncharacterized transport system involved in gliding motility auxiliary subunit